MKTDELRRELLDIAATSTRSTATARVHGRVQRGASPAGALLVLSRCPSGSSPPVRAATIRYRWRGRRSPLRSRSSTASRQSSWCRSPGRLATPLDRSLPWRSTRSDYAARPNPRRVLPDARRAECREAPEQLVDQLPPDAIVNFGAERTAHRMARSCGRDLHERRCSRPSRRRAPIAESDRP